MFQSLKKILFNTTQGNKETQEQLAFQNEYGGFCLSTNEYIIRHGASVVTPRPWSNILANEHFGTIVTESALGCTWFDNSKDKRISSWPNDPVSDISPEAVYIKNKQSGEFWTISRLPVGVGEGETKSSYEVKHGLGYSTFLSSRKDMEQQMTVFVDLHDQVKVIKISLKNITSSRQDVSLYYYIDLILSNFRHQYEPFTSYQKNEGSNVLRFVRTEKKTHSKTVFATSNLPLVSWTSNKTAFLGIDHVLSRPSGIASHSLQDLPQYPQCNCAVIQVDAELLPGEEKEMVFVLGAADSSEHAEQLGTKYTTLTEVYAALDAVKKFWFDFTHHVQIKTPDPSVDIMFNQWLLYQTLACRFWGRSSFYQSSGAFGFRDQLQDSLAFLYSEPQVCRAHILQCASRQFEEGDVQHWWFPDTSIGVRNNMSDSALWLPYAIHHYIEKTGDDSILHEEVSYIKGRATSESEPAYVAVPEVSQIKETIWDHCLKAIHRVAVFGEHGLPLMKEGDWNDGMSRVGPKGNGESVWLGWFMCYVLKTFIKLAENRNEIEVKNRLTNILENLSESLHENAWDGEWYKRAYFDDGSPLGSRLNEDCKIDSVAQSWAVIADVDYRERLVKAMESGFKYLVDEEIGIVKLLTPSFDKGPENPGYIKNYVPGIRENGGQYNHAVYWFVMALGRLKMGERALELLNFTNPIKKTETADKLKQYELEPYVVAGDIYNSTQHPGKGGWSWYSASAGLMYRGILVCILGFRLYGDTIKFNPSVPSDWKEYSIDYKYKSTQYKVHYTIATGHQNHVLKVVHDGVSRDTDTIQLTDDNKTHQIEVFVG